MKQLSLLVAVMSLLFLSCDKKMSADSLPLTLEGNWRMVAVKDNSSGVIITKPDSIQGDVDLTFTVLSDSSGTFQGQTPTNEITINPYLIGTNHQLTIPFVGMSYVIETSWGDEFVNNICKSQQYNFENENKLIITTTDKTLTFQRQ